MIINFHIETNFLLDSKQGIRIGLFFDRSCVDTHRSTAALENATGIPNVAAKACAPGLNSQSLKDRWVAAKEVIDGQEVILDKLKRIRGPLEFLIAVGGAAAEVSFVFIPREQWP